MQSVNRQWNRVGGALKSRMSHAAMIGVLAIPAFCLATSYAPVQIRNAYGFNSLPSNVTGSNQTIGIIDFSNAPNITSDLATFDSDFGIAAPPSFSIVDQSNGTTSTKFSASEINETSLDVEYVHAIAPGARIVLVEAPDLSVLTNGELANAVNTAVNQGSTVISMSFGSAGGESASEEAFEDTLYNRTNVTFVASSGDTGTFNYPASSPYVIGVGGTSLTINNGVNNGFINASGGTYGSETTWNNASGSGGGGVDPNELLPTYQLGVTGESSTTNRNEPDVSYDADPATGFDFVENGSAFSGIGGTSAGAPQWAGLIALANQLRVNQNMPTLSSFQALTLLYNVYKTNPTLYAELFHDINDNSKNSAGYVAGTGYDNATGLGTPIANNVVDFLAGLPVPEPAALLMAVNVGMLLVGRRRRTPSA